MWCFHTTERDFVLERKDILTPTAVGEDLAETIPSDISQSQKDKSYRIPLIGGPAEESHSRRQKDGGTRSWGEDDEELASHGDRVLALDDEKLREMDSGDGFTTM